MEEQDGQQAGTGEQTSGQEGAGSEFAPITTQDELNRLIGARLDRERQKFADYDALREKAAKYDEVEESAKSELQKITERAEAAERRAAEFEQTALKTRIAAELGVIPEVVQGTDEETMRASAQRVLEWAKQGVRQPPPTKQLASGASSAPTGEKGRAAAALRALRQG